MLRFMLGLTNNYSDTFRIVENIQALRRFYKKQEFALKSSILQAIRHLSKLPEIQPETNDIHELKNRENPGPPHRPCC